MTHLSSAMHPDLDYQLYAAGREAVRALDEAASTLTAILASGGWGSRGQRALAAELEMARTLILRDRMLVTEVMGYAR